MDKLILLGAVGGFLPDILRIVAAGREGTVPAFLGKGIFWVSLVLLAGIGALVVWVFGAASPKEALALGFGGPELISRLVGSIGQTDRTGEEGPQPGLTLSDWWRY